MPSDVKICGLTRPQDVEAAIRYGAAYIGFIVETKSSRKLSISDAARLAKPAQNIVSRVAVIVNASDALFTDIMTEMEPDCVQCHGDETPERLAEIQQRFQVKTIKALPISTAEDLKKIDDYAEVSDFVLLDAKPPKGAARGGHGEAFDWSLLNGAHLPDRWVLAGGLNPDNVGEALAQTHAPILDVSSGVEAAPGLKDKAKMKAFMETVGHG